MLDHVDVVLARPSEPRNIGSACRAAKSASITRVIVAGASFDRTAAAPLAVGAVDVLDTIVTTDDLSRVLGDYAVVAGITRRTGQRRKLRSYLPREFAAVARDSAPGRVAIVFGNEQSGLSDEELSLCNLAVSIPTAEICPSLNLSHAVQVICYELFVAAVPDGRQSAPIGQRVIASTVDEIVGSLHDIGYPAQSGPQGLPRFLSDLFGRARLTEAEAQRVQRLFADIAGRWRRLDRSTEENL